MRRLGLGPERRRRQRLQDHRPRLARQRQSRALERPGRRRRRRWRTGGRASTDSDSWNISTRPASAAQRSRRRIEPGRVTGRHQRSPDSFLRPFSAYPVSNMKKTGAEAASASHATGTAPNVSWMDAMRAAKLSYTPGTIRAWVAALPRRGSMRRRAADLNQSRQQIVLGDRLQSIAFIGVWWRRDPESNWAQRICNPGFAAFFRVELQSRNSLYLP